MRKWIRRAQDDHLALMCYIPLDSPTRDLGGDQPLGARSIRCAIEPLERRGDRRQSRPRRAALLAPHTPYEPRNSHVSCVLPSQVHAQANKTLLTPSLIQRRIKCTNITTLAGLYQRAIGRLETGIRCEKGRMLRL